MACVVYVLYAWSCLSRDPTLAAPCRMTWGNTKPAGLHVTMKNLQFSLPPYAPFVSYYNIIESLRLRDNPPPTRPCWAHFSLTSRLGLFAHLFLPLYIIALVRLCKGRKVFVRNSYIYTCFLLRFGTSRHVQHWKLRNTVVLVVQVLK